GRSPGRRPARALPVATCRCGRGCGSPAPSASRRCCAAAGGRHGMAPEPPRLVRRATFAMLALAAAATEVAAAETRPVPASLGLAALWVGLAAGLGRLVPAPRDARAAPPRLVLVLLLALAAAPFLAEPLR